MASVGLAPVMDRPNHIQTIGRQPLAISDTGLERIPAGVWPWSRTSRPEPTQTRAWQRISRCRKALPYFAMLYHVVTDATYVRRSCGWCQDPGALDKSAIQLVGGPASARWL